MKYTDIKPHLTAEAFNAFIDITDWLDAGGKPNATIPFQYHWNNCYTCVGGALDHLVNSENGSIVMAGSFQGMTEAEAVDLFLSSDSCRQSPQNMAKVIRGWLTTGEICWIDSGDVCWIGSPPEGTV